MKPKNDLFYMSHGVNRATLKEGIEDERINFLDKLVKNSKYSMIFMDLPTSSQSGVTILIMR